MVSHDPLISIVDSFPMPVCRFARANRCRIFAGQAAFGYDEVARPQLLETGVASGSETART